MPAIHLNPRRGRSAKLWSFVRQPLGPPIRSETPYSFAVVLEHENKFVMGREDADPVYRGDVRPQDSCGGQVLVLLSDIDSDEEDELASDQSTVPSTPELRPASPLEHLTSPVTPLPARFVSPTVTDFASPPPVKITYVRRDRARFHTQQRQAELQRAKNNAAVKRRLKALGPRRSGRIHRAYINVDSPGVWTCEQLVAVGNVIENVEKKALTPLVDSEDCVMGVIAGPPKNELQWWEHVIKHAEQSMSRLYRNGEFTNLGYEEACVRFGISFGELELEDGDVPKPHLIEVNSANLQEIALIQESPKFRYISLYQNYLVHHIAPKLYFDLADKVCQLKARAKVTTPFPDSIFTTAEISFGDVPNLSRKNWDATFYGLKAVTSFGHYDWRKRGGFVSWDNNRVIPLQPGATVIFSAGTKRFSFVPVAPNETCFLFRQYCHAGALRWVEKDGRSDAEFEAEVSAAEAEAWDVKRTHRGKIAAQMYSKIGDIYVF